MFFGFQYYFLYEFKVNILVHRHFSKDTQKIGLIVMNFKLVCFFVGILLFKGSLYVVLGAVDAPRTTNAT